MVMKDLRIWEYINPKKENEVNDYLSVLCTIIIINMAQGKP